MTAVQGIEIEMSREDEVVALVRAAFVMGGIAATTSDAQGAHVAERVAASCAATATIFTEHAENQRPGFLTGLALTHPAEAAFLTDLLASIDADAEGGEA